MGKGVQYVNPTTARKVTGLYSHVAITEAGRLAHIAGQVATDDGGQPVAPGDVAAQVPVVFDAIGGILKGLGVGFSDVASFTTYVVGTENREAWARARSAMYEKLYPDKAYPPNTLLYISGLARPEFVVEISAVVKLP